MMKGFTYFFWDVPEIEIIIEIFVNIQLQKILFYFCEKWYN